MAKCTGVRCPMQYGYKVEECNHTDCPYRTEPITNADRIRAMSDEELCSVVRLAAYADVCYMSCECHECVFHGLCKEYEAEMFSDEQEEITTVMKWLKQPAKGECE